MNTEEAIKYYLSDKASSMEHEKALRLISLEIKQNLLIHNCTGISLKEIEIYLKNGATSVL